jgi:hypothetical protein
LPFVAEKQPACPAESYWVVRLFICSTATLDK